MSFIFASRLIQLTKYLTTKPITLASFKTTNLSSNYPLTNLICLYSSNVSSKNENNIIDWKKDVVIQPIQTTKADLRNKRYKNAIYIDHRRYVENVPDEYTIEPFKTKGTGGRDLETGERLFRRVGGGLPVTWYWVDFKRVGPKSGPPLIEKVIDIFPSRDRTSFIALVAHGNIKRYILATKNMKINDLIRTSCEIPRNPVKAYEGDAYPVGALPMGTIIHNIEIEPGKGGQYCRAAGSSATLVRKLGDRCIVKLPSSLEISVNENCMATIGQVSHASYKDEKLTHAVDIRDLGYRPRSGLWQRKGGRFGRRIKLPKPIKVVDSNKETKLKRIPYEYSNWSLTE